MYKYAEQFTSRRLWNLLINICTSGEILVCMFMWKIQNETMLYFNA